MKPYFELKPSISSEQRSTSKNRFTILSLCEHRILPTYRSWSGSLTQDHVDQTHCTLTRTQPGLLTSFLPTMRNCQVSSEAVVISLIRK